MRSWFLPLRNTVDNIYYLLSTSFKVSVNLSFYVDMVFAIHDIHFILSFSKPDNELKLWPTFFKLTPPHWCPPASIVLHSHRSQVCQRLAPVSGSSALPGCPMNSIFLCDVKNGGKITSTKSLASTQETGSHDPSPYITPKRFTTSRMHICPEDKSFLLLSQKPLFVWWHWGKELIFTLGSEFNSFRPLVSLS